MSLTPRRSPAAAHGVGARRPDATVRTRRRTSPLRRLARGAVIAAAGSAALALAGPLALRPLADAAGAAGEVTVAFVLDVGGTTGVVAGCVSVPASDNRYDALAAFTASRGLAAPTYASSGLLCSLDGIPASGCGQTVPGGYVYWSYFTGGSGTWSYASSGAFGTVTAGDVEGWRFQDPGTGRANDPPPRSTAQYAAICPPAPTPTTTTTTTAPTATTTTTGAGPAAPAAGGGARPAAPATGGTPAVPPTATGTGGTVATGSPSASPARARTAADPSTGTTAVGRGTASGAGPWPLVAGGLLVLGLGAAAWVRWRRRLGAP